MTAGVGPQSRVSRPHSENRQESRASEPGLAESVASAAAEIRDSSWGVFPAGCNAGRWRLLGGLDELYCTNVTIKLITSSITTRLRDVKFAILFVFKCVYGLRD